MKNIIFIGLPGCGKTAVSKRLAEALDRPWFDSDLEIEAGEHMCISDLFDQKGEEYFRQRETECITRLVGLQGAVIAVGGGAVLRNAGLIRENAIVIYLKRSVESILSTLEPDTRPLLRDKSKLHELYGQRRGLYEQLCDIMVCNDGSIEDTVKKIREALA